MAGFSNDYEQKILETVFRGIDPTPWQVLPTGSFYVALFNVVPGDDGLNGTEVYQGNISLRNYARAEVPVTNLNINTNVDEISIVNTADVDFQIPTQTWGTIEGFGLYTDATGTELVAFDRFDFPITGDAGAQIKFSAGNLKLILD